MAHPKRPELQLGGNVSENFKNFELRFNDYCIQTEYRDLGKNPTVADELSDHYKKPQLEISALRSSMPDEALSVIRYTIEPQILPADRLKPWIWLEKLREHYVGTSGGTVLSDRYSFWELKQLASQSIQDWEVTVRQSGSLCEYESMTHPGEELKRDKFIFGIQNQEIRTLLLNDSKKLDGSKKKLADVVIEARAMEAARQTNKLIVDTTKLTEEVHWTSHRDMKLKRETNTCHWCGDKRGPHPWKSCPANGRTCTNCGGNDHFSTVCREDASPRKSGQTQRHGRGGRGKPRNYGNKQTRFGQGPTSHTSQEVRQVDYRNEEDVVHASGLHQCYSLEPRQVHQIDQPKVGKRYYSNLSLSPRGNNFTTHRLQIDTASTCNTMSEDELTRLGTAVQVRPSPYLLYPYGDSKPLKPVGQVDLVCETKNRYVVLTFQILPNSVMGGKPPLLSGADSEMLA